MSVERDVRVDLDLDENAASVTVTRTEETDIANLFIDGELRLWQDSAGWDGYLKEETDDGPVYYRVNTRHGSDDWVSKARVGVRAVREAVREHIEDPLAGGEGRFVRGCSPP